MSKEGILDCLDNGFTDKRRHNSYVPFKLIMAMAIAAKMKIHTSLTDIPYAIAFWVFQGGIVGGFLVIFYFTN